jgi:hypothetical protein
MSTKAAIVRLSAYNLIGTEITTLKTLTTIMVTTLHHQKTMKSPAMSTLDILEHVKLHGEYLNLKCKAEILQYVVCRYTFPQSNN